MQLLILFCLQTDLINHFIFSESTEVFIFIHNYMATSLQLQIFTFSFTFFVYLARIIVIVSGYCCFYVYCVNVHFHREKKEQHF